MGSSDVRDLGGSGPGEQYAFLTFMEIPLRE
jgi:hypothetical protein